MSANLRNLIPVIVVSLLVGSGVGVHSSSGASGEMPAQTSDGDAGSSKGVSVKFRRISSNDYANFPANWPAGHTYRLGLIRSAAEYDQVFHAAGVAGNLKPYAPDPRIYEKEMIVSVSRVTPAPPNLDKALQIDSIVSKGKTLEVYFTFREGSRKESYTVKVTGAARIPKQEVQRVLFFESKKPVGELNIANGQWLKPEPEASESAQP